MWCLCRKNTQQGGLSEKPPRGKHKAGGSEVAGKGKGGVETCPLKTRGKVGRRSSVLVERSVHQKKQVLRKTKGGVKEKGGEKVLKKEAMEKRNAKRESSPYGKKKTTEKKKLQKK